MKKLISLVLIGLTLSGCFLRTHKMDIEQGNIISQQDVSRLRLGMTEHEVKQIMGDPVLVNIFAANRLDYVYTYQRGYSNMLETRVICIFKHGRLTEIIT